MRARIVLPLILGLLVGCFIPIFFQGSASDCRLVYALLGGGGTFLLAGLVLWLPYVPPGEGRSDPCGYTSYYQPPAPPPQPMYHGPSAYDAWREGQRERARLMWLDGTPTPPTDWWG